MDPHRKTILFACTENRKRSQMAELIFNHFATKGHAISAGTMPSDDPEPGIKDVLREAGIPVTHEIVPRRITEDMLQHADIIVSFGCLVPSMFPPDKFEEWHMPDPQTPEELRAVRDGLIKKVKEFIREYDL